MHLQGMLSGYGQSLVFHHFYCAHIVDAVSLQGLSRRFYPTWRHVK